MPSSTAASEISLDRNLGLRDNGVTWQEMGPKATFPASLYNGYAQLWSWDYNPDDGWVYVVSTGFQRDKGIILRAYARGTSAT